VYYRLSIAQKLFRSDSWTTGDRNIALLLAGIGLAVVPSLLILNLYEISSHNIQSRRVNDRGRRRIESMQSSKNLL